MRFRYIRCRMAAPLSVINLRHVEPGRGIDARWTPDTAPPRLRSRCCLRAVHKLPGQGDGTDAPELYLHDAQTSRACPAPPGPVPRTGSATGWPAAYTPSAADSGPPPPRPGFRRPLGLTHGVWPPTFSGRSCRCSGQGPYCIQHLIVELGAVALVLCKLVLGILCVQLRGHVPVPADLGQNGRRRDGGALAVAADDQPMGDLNSVPAAVIPVAVDERQIRPEGQPVHAPSAWPASGR